MSFPRYKQYKDSGPTWFGRVPSHWDVLNGRRVFTQKRNASLPDDPQLSATQKYGVIPQTLFMELEQQKVVLALKGTDAFKHVEIDDFIISLRSFQGGIEKSHYRGCVSTAYTVLRSTKDIDAKYWEYLLKSSPYIDALSSVTDGIREGRSISYAQFGGLPLPFPCMYEQTAIAAFLDYETAKIDALIEEQRQLIELLKEKRQAVISHAVTKGLNPDAPMKDSGTFWIGKVPQHWDVSSLRYFARFSSGSTPDRMKESYWGGDIPWVKTGEIDYAVINTTEEAISVEGMAESSVTLVPAGSMLLALYGQGVTRGRVAMLGVAATFNQACVAIESDERIDRAYLYAFFVFAYQFIREIGNETTQMNLNLDFVKGIRMLLPPLPEQRSIAEVVAAQMSSSDALVEEAKNAIKLLQERRTALISAAVTGKIDVRGERNGVR